MRLSKMLGMKSTRTSIAAFLLLSLFHEIAPSNPDSETVQDPSNDNKDDQKKSAPIVAYEDPERIASAESRVFFVSTAGDLRQLKPDVVIMWRQFSPLGTTPSRTVKTRNRFPTRTYNNGNMRTDMVVPTDDKSTSYSSNDDRPNIPDEFRPPDSRPESTNVKTVTRGGGGYSASFVPNPTSNVYAPSNERPSASANGNRFGESTSYGARVPGPNDNNPRIKNTQNDCPTSSPRYSPQPPIEAIPSRIAGGSSNRRNTARPVNTPLVQNPGKRVSPDSSFFAGIINDFSFKLVETLNLETNFVISPLSIFIALSMCYLGSEGTTRTQLERELGLDANEVHGSNLHKGVHDLVSLISAQSSDYQLFLANGMFLAKNFSVHPEFEGNIQRYYDAELKNLDFTNADLSIPIINNWVSSRTSNTIRSFFSSPIDPLTRIVVLNAIYFKGIWKTQFSTRMTYEGNFFPLDGSTKKIPTMVMYNETFPLYRSDDYKHSFIKLPYQGDQIAMIIAMPDNFGDKPMPRITDRNLCNIRDSMADTRLDTVAIPKFRFEHTSLLRGALRRMGITDLFDLKTVNLSKMRSQNDVVVSSITHKAVLEVNEQGTTASAVTGVQIIPLTYRNTTDFVINRPFSFYVVHEPSGLVLFYGKVYDINNEKVDVAPNSPPRESILLKGRFSGRG